MLLQRYGVSQVLDRGVQPFRDPHLAHGQGQEAPLHPRDLERHAKGHDDQGRHQMQPSVVLGLEQDRKAVEGKSEALESVADREATSHWVAASSSRR